jgi:ABC-type glycerol-3-phosphate transport system permease component
MTQLASSKPRLARSPAHAQSRVRTWTRRPPIVRLVEYGILVLASLVALVPLDAMLTASLAEPDAFTGSIAPPANPVFYNYPDAWQVLGFRTLFTNSVLLSVTTAVLTTGLAAMAAFGLIRYRFAGRSALIIGFVALIAVTPIRIIIPLFLRMADFGWVAEIQAAPTALAGLFLPFAIMLLFSFMRDLPGELFEAATVDGASGARQFWHIALPLSRSSVSTVALVTAVFAWNDLLVPLILWPTADLQTLTVGLASLGPSRTGLRSVPVLMAGVALSVAPMVFLFLFARKAFLRGLTEGAVK